MTLNTNHIYRAFNEEIDKAQLWVKSRMANVCGHSADLLANRLMQRLVELSLCKYTSAVKRSSAGGAYKLPLPGTQLDCERAYLELGSGRITISVRQWSRNQGEFLLHWLFCTFAIVVPRFWKPERRTAVLVFGVGQESLFVDSCDERFIDYCRNGPIRPLRNGERYLIQSAISRKSAMPGIFYYCRNPLVELTRSSHLGCLQRVGLLWKQLTLVIIYIKTTLRIPQLSLLGRDFAYIEIASMMDRGCLIEAVVLTTSGYTRQALWTRKLSNSLVHMVWYAQNFKPIVYVSDGIDSDVPNLRWIKVDTHWVWTYAFADCLRSVGQTCTMEVVGPILWYKKVSATCADKQIEIVVFDVPPYSDEVAIGLGEFSNYNHPNNLVAFINDIVALKDRLELHFQLPVVLRLKMKRGYRPIYDKAYFLYLEELAAKGGLRLENHWVNIYTLIESSHLVIAYPFTSPAYVAEAVETPVIYYDATNSICRGDFADAKSAIKFASSREALLDVAITVLGDVSLGAESGVRSDSDN